MGWSLRAATLSDVDAVAGVQVQSWRETYEGILPESVIRSRTWNDRRSLWRRVISEARQLHIVADIPGEGVVGFVNGGPARVDLPGADVEIYALYVLRAFHGQGIGRALFERARSSFRAQKAAHLALWVQNKNPATAFYEAMGGVAGGVEAKQLGGQLCTSRRYDFGLDHED